MANEPTYVDPEELKQKNAPDGEQVPPGQPSVAQATPQQPELVQAQPATPQPIVQTAPPQPEQAPNEEKKQPNTNEEIDKELSNKQKPPTDQRYTADMKKKKEKEEFDPDHPQQKVDSVAARADNVLIRLKTVFPYDFFPSTVVIDANKVTIIDKTFFASETVTSILLEEITDVVVNANFFLAQMVITYSHHPLQPIKYSIASLRKKEALRAKEIIQGLLVLRLSEGIDLSKLKPEEIIEELAKIGDIHEHLPAL